MRVIMLLLLFVHTFFYLWLDKYIVTFYTASSLDLRTHTHFHYFAVSLVTRLQAEQSGVWFLARERYFSSVQNVQTNTGTHLASCSVGTGVHSLESEWVGRATSPHPLVGRLMTAAIVLLYAIMAWTWTAVRFYSRTKVQSPDISSLHTDVRLLEKPGSTRYGSNRTSVPP
jgi:hypothetical protein